MYYLYLHSAHTQIYVCIYIYMVRFQPPLTAAMVPLPPVVCWGVWFCPPTPSVVVGGVWCGVRGAGVV